MIDGLTEGDTFMSLTHLDEYLSSAAVLHPTRLKGVMKIMPNVLLNTKGVNLNLEEPRTSFEEIVWDVSFSSANFEHVADWTYEELARITRYQSNVELPDKKDLVKYFATLTFCRVKVSRGERLPEGHKPATLRRLFIPARFSMILSMIGEVVYPDVAVRIKPSTSITEDDIFNMEQTAKIAQQLERFFEDGFCGTMGMSMDRYGDPHFMNKVAIIEEKPQSCIKSMTKDNPLYGFMAWIMNAELLEVAYNEARYLLRVNYSDPVIYSSMARMTWNGWKPSNDNGTKNNEDPYQNGTANVQEDNSNS